MGVYNIATKAIALQEEQCICSWSSSSFAVQGTREDRIKGLTQRIDA